MNPKRKDSPLQNKLDHENEKAKEDCWKVIGVWGRASKKCPELAKVAHCRNCLVYSRTGRRLLNRFISPEYQQELTHRFAQEKKKPLVNLKSAFIFRAGGEWLALSAKLIHSVIDMGVIHTIPNMSNNVLRGVVNVRGKLEICVSIGGVLGIERLERVDKTSSYVAPERLVVAAHEGNIVTFPVSEVMGVVRFQPDMLRELPVTVSGSKAVYTQGILYINNRDIGFLKDAPLFKSLTKDLT